jgi:hypothetical protein
VACRSRAIGVVVGHFGAHVVARLPILRRRHLEARVVVIGDVRLVRGQHGFLVNQTAAWIERVGESAFETAHAQAVEHDLHAIADAARDGATQPERALHVASPIWMARGIVEERVPAATALPGLTLVERACAANNRLALEADGGDERLAGIEREGRPPRPRALVGPSHRYRVFAANDARRARPHAAEIDRRLNRRRLQRNERQGTQGNREECS